MNAGRCPPSGGAAARPTPRPPCALGRRLHRQRAPPRSPEHQPRRTLPSGPDRPPNSRKDGYSGTKVRLGPGGSDAVTLAPRRKRKRLHHAAPNELAERAVDDVLLDAGGLRNVGSGDAGALANNREDHLAVGAAGPALSGLRLGLWRVARGRRPYFSGLVVEPAQGSQCRRETLILDLRVPR